MTEPWLHTPEDPRIFVFGSNTSGIHGAGAAAYAAGYLGAEDGIGEGLTGRAYAIPTRYVRDGQIQTLPFSYVAFAVDRFINFADKHPELRFFVSKVGCGLAGFTEKEMKYLFRDSPSNVDLPPGWLHSV